MYFIFLALGISHLVKQNQYKKYEDLGYCFVLFCFKQPFFERAERVSLMESCPI